jgi:hypothetical protein
VALLKANVLQHHITRNIDMCTVSVVFPLFCSTPVYICIFSPHNDWRECTYRILIIFGMDLLYINVCMFVFVVYFTKPSLAQTEYFRILG